MAALLLAFVGSLSAVAVAVRAPGRWAAAAALVPVGVLVVVILLGVRFPLVPPVWTGVVLGAVLLGGLIFAINTYNPPSPGNAAGLRTFALEKEGVSQIQIIGWDLFTRYVYPFELTSILLLVGVIGVMILTKRRSLPVASDATKP